MMYDISCVVMIFGVSLLWGAIVLEVIHASHGKVVAQAHNCCLATQRKFTAQGKIVAYHTTVNLWLSAAL